MCNMCIWWEGWGTDITTSGISILWSPPTNIWTVSVPRVTIIANNALSRRPLVASVNGGHVIHTQRPSCWTSPYWLPRSTWSWSVSYESGFGQLRSKKWRKFAIHSFREVQVKKNYLRSRSRNESEIKMIRNRDREVKVKWKSFEIEIEKWNFSRI